MAIEGRTRLGTALLIVLPLWIGMYVLFVKLLHVPWPPSLLGDALPWLRSATGVDLIESDFLWEDLAMPPQSDITRRALLRSTAIGIAALAAGGARVYAQTVAKPPNIVFIMADDLGYADVSCYGRRDFVTPNIDRIATRGVRFLQGYVNSAVCSATRLALITGRYQYRLRLGLEEPLAGNVAVGLPPEHPTLPSLLKKAGYGTSLIGKWHLGFLPKFGPLKSGYDHFYGFRGGAVDYFSHANGAREDFWDDDVPLHRAGYLTDLLGSRAVEVINGY